jgi:hypothetical protein
LSYFDDYGNPVFAAHAQTLNANQSMLPVQAEGSYLPRNSLAVPFHNSSGTAPTPDTPRAGLSSQPSAAIPTRKKKMEEEQRRKWQADLLEALSVQGQVPIPSINNTDINQLRNELETSQRPEVVRFQPFGLRSQEDPNTFYYPINPTSHPSLSTASSLLQGSEASPVDVVGFVQVAYGGFLENHHRGRKPRPANFTGGRRPGRPSQEEKWWWNGPESQRCVCGKVFNSQSGLRDHVMGGLSRGRDKGGDARDTYVSGIPKTTKTRKNKAKANTVGPIRTHDLPQPAEADAAIPSTSTLTDPSAPVAAADRKRNADKACYVMKQQLSRTSTGCFFCDAQLTPPKSKDEGSRTPSASVQAVGGAEIAVAPVPSRGRRVDQAPSRRC